LLVFAALFFLSAAAVLTVLGAALVVARLAAVGVGAVGAVAGGTSGVSAGAVVVMSALMLAHLGLSGTVNGLLSGLIVVARGKAECKSGSY
jgi:hypothetical protein